MSHPKQLEFFNRQMLHKDLAWYSSHFDGTRSADRNTAVIRGEITPFYARLGDDAVRRIAQLIPDAKIVLVVRNPIDRTWSHLLYHYGVYQKRDINRLRPEQLICFALRQRTVRYTDYVSIINRWRNAFGRDRVHVAVFDDLARDPQAFLQRILLHIGADPDGLGHDEPLSERVLSAESLLRTSHSVPPIVEWALALQWVDDVRSLNRLLNGVVSPWVERLENAALDGKPAWKLRRELARFLWSVPERMAYRVYDAILERRMNIRWSELFRELAPNHVRS